LSRMRIIRVDD